MPFSICLSLPLVTAEAAAGEAKTGQRHIRLSNSGDFSYNQVGGHTAAGDLPAGLILARSVRLASVIFPALRAAVKPARMRQDLITGCRLSRLIDTSAGAAKSANKSWIRSNNSHILAVFCAPCARRETP